MSIGLVVFIVVVISDVAGLLIDLVIWWKYGYQSTITAMVRDGDITLGLLIIALQVIGIVGLTQHFWGWGMK
jgi:hypothetical protein